MDLAEIPETAMSVRIEDTLDSFVLARENVPSIRRRPVGSVRLCDMMLRTVLLTTEAGVSRREQVVDSPPVPALTQLNLKTASSGSVASNYLHWTGALSSSRVTEDL